MSGEPPKSHSWWQTLPGILTAVAGILTASTGLILALNQVGVFSRASTSALPTTTSTVVVSASPSAKPATGLDTEVSVATGVDELERRLKAANILLSTGDEREKVLGYFVGSDAPYRLLAVSCIQILGNQRLKKTGYLDMIDKHYSEMVSDNNYGATDGKLDLEKVKKAMVEAQREYHTDPARTFEEIVEFR